MAMKVVAPARISVRTLDPRALILKKRSTAAVLPSALRAVSPLIMFPIIQRRPGGGADTPVAVQFTGDAHVTPGRRSRQSDAADPSSLGSPLRGGSARFRM